MIIQPIQLLLIVFGCGLIGATAATWYLLARR